MSCGASAAGLRSATPGESRAAEGHPPRQGVSGTISEQGEKMPQASRGACLPPAELPPTTRAPAHLEQVGCGQVEAVWHKAETGAKRQRQVPNVPTEGQSLRDPIQLQDPGGMSVDRG